MRRGPWKKRREEQDDGVRGGSGRSSSKKSPNARNRVSDGFPPKSRLGELNIKEESPVPRQLAFDSQVLRGAL